jgi:hypothetical protein
MKALKTAAHDLNKKEKQATWMRGLPRPTLSGHHQHNPYQRQMICATWLGVGSCYAIEEAHGHL